MANISLDLLRWSMLCWLIFMQSISKICEPLFIGMILIELSFAEPSQEWIFRSSLDLCQDACWINVLHEMWSFFAYLYVKYSITEFHSMNRIFSGRADDKDALSCKCIFLTWKYFCLCTRKFEIGCYGLPGFFTCRRNIQLVSWMLDGSSYQMIFKILFSSTLRTEACLLSWQKKKNSGSRTNNLHKLPITMFVF